MWNSCLKSTKLLSKILSKILLLLIPHRYSQDFKAMNSLVKLLCEKISTFTNLKMGSLRNELHARGIDLFEKTEAEIKKGTLSILRCIQRPPALLCTDAQISSMSYYEIPSCKPLHDSTNLIKNLKKKLPVNIENKQTQVEFEKCSSVTVEGMNIHFLYPTIILYLWLQFSMFRSSLLMCFVFSSRS